MHFLYDIINILSCSLIFIFFTFLLRGDKLCFTYITRQTLFTYFLLQQKKVTKKTYSVFLLFGYALPDAVTAPAHSAPAYMRRLKAALPHASSLRSCGAVTQSPLCHLLRFRSYTAPLPPRAIRLYLVQSGFFSSLLFYFL